MSHACRVHAPVCQHVQRRAAPSQHLFWSRANAANAHGVRACIPQLCASAERVLPQHHVGLAGRAAVVPDCNQSLTYVYPETIRRRGRADYEHLIWSRRLFISCVVAQRRRGGAGCASCRGCWSQPRRLRGTAAARRVSPTRRTRACCRRGPPAVQSAHVSFAHMLPSSCSLWCPTCNVCA